MLEMILLVANLASVWALIRTRAQGFDYAEDANALDHALGWLTRASIATSTALAAVVICTLADAAIDLKRDADSLSYIRMHRGHDPDPTRSAQAVILRHAGIRLLVAVFLPLVARIHLMRVRRDLEFRRRRAT